MAEARRKRRDLLQDVVIVLLALSAAFLFMRTQLYNLGEEGYQKLFDPAAVQAGGNAASQTAGTSAPVRVAVTGPYGRYASVTLTTAGEEFDALGRLLGEALGSAGSMTECGQETFFNALNGTSVYYDFLNPLPLSVLAGFSGAETEEETAGRVLVVSAGEDRVEICIWDGEASYRRCTTAVTRESLETVVNRYELGNASFAFETLQEEPVLPVLSRSIPAYDMDAVLDALCFNPNTQSRYVESSGTEVIVENGRSLRLRTNGTLVYQSGGEDALRIEGEETGTLRELAAGSGVLLKKLAELSDSDAELYLEQVRQNGDMVTLSYGYQVGGVPIRFSDGESAASITLEGTTVLELTLRFRRYTAAEETSRLLPLRQAAAIMAQYEETALFIGYADDGGSRMPARWLAE